MRMWRSYPVLFTLGVGAILGFSVATALMFIVGPISVVTNRPAVTARLVKKSIILKPS